MERKVVITGIGIIAPCGKDTGTFWNNCLAGQAAVSKIPEKWQDFSKYNSTIWAPLPELDLAAYGISRIDKMQLDMTSLLALAATNQALNHAGLECTITDAKKNISRIEGIDPVRCGVYLGTGVGGINSLIQNVSNHINTPVKKGLKELKKELTSDSAGQEKIIESCEDKIIMPLRFNPFIVSMIMPNACAANIGIKNSVKGINKTVTTACAAGTCAIGGAYEMVASGRADVMITGGVEYLNEPFGGIFRGFDIAGTLASNREEPEKANRPFDRDRTGFLFSEGAGAILILEEAEHAASRGAPVIAEITGFTESFDAHNIMIMEPQGIMIKQMIRSCLDQAGLDSSDIDYINAHGTGTMVNDEAEAAVIDDIFGKKPLINSTKSLTGHTIGASGAIEAAVTALSILHKTTHPCKNLENPIRDLNFAMKQEHLSIRHGLSQSFAFGGHNAALIISEFRG